MASPKRKPSAKSTNGAASSSRSFIGGGPRAAPFSRLCPVFGLTPPPQLPAPTAEASLPRECVYRRVMQTCLPIANAGVANAFSLYTTALSKEADPATYFLIATSLVSGRVTLGRKPFERPAETSYCAAINGAPSAAVASFR